MSHLTLPHKAKPSAATSKDDSRPALTRAHLRENPEGEFELWASDSYVMVCVPLTVEDESKSKLPTPGAIGPGELKIIESAGGFTERSGVIFAVKDGVETGVSHTRCAPVTGKNPLDSWVALIPKAKRAERYVRVALNPSLLLNMASAFGCCAKAVEGCFNGVELLIELPGEVDVGTAPATLKPIRVRPLGPVGKGTGVLMPIRGDDQTEWDKPPKRVRKPKAKASA
jgi:hypothetical protein